MIYVHTNIGLHRDLGTPVQQITYEAMLLSGWFGLSWDLWALLG